MNRRIHAGLRNHKVIGFLLAICLIVLHPTLCAGTLSESDVHSAVQTWVRFLTADARPDAYIE
jgi:hypothetical protein